MRSRTKSKLINIISCSISAILLVVLAIQFDAERKNKENELNTQLTNSTVSIVSSVYLEEVQLVSDAVNGYMNLADSDDANTVYKNFDGWGHNLNVSQPWEFSYQVVGLPVNAEIKSVILELAENDSFKDAKKIEPDVNDYKISVYNLKPSTEYYYRLKLILSDDSYCGAEGKFVTAKSPRILTVDGAVNVRDIGGYKTANGKKIAYGKLYRGSEIDGKVEAKYKITEAGKNQMLKDLGVRFDLDLRGKEFEKDASDMLGSGVKHKYFDASYYSGIFDSNSQKVVRDIFAELSRKQNYPMYMHCTYGRDRTGTICYLLEALLGVDDDDLYRDYALSAFTDSFIETEKFETFINDIEALPGKTTQEKVEKWLLSIGVTQGEINNIRQILLED